ncbi:MAG: ATP-binding protein, partial [Ignavibacteria bacterium]|nr:ATP-binding protein [Ignavibacteria bacterium]
MKIIIGQAARGEDFFPRPKISDEIWRKIESGSNILLVAPRRVGKSSLLFDLFENPKPGYLVVYYTSESVNNINEFYKKLFYKINEILGITKKYKYKIEGFTKELFSRIDALSVKDLAITLGENKISYLTELTKMLANLELENERLIILVDEFAQTVEN